MRTIAGNPHLATSQEVHWVVSIRWRAQGGAYLLDEWTDLCASSIAFARLYDGFQPGMVTAEPLLHFLSELPVTGDVRSEAQATLEVMTTRELAGHPGSTFADLWDEDHPPEYADVFVSVVLGESGSRQTILCWSGAVEAVLQLEDRVRITVSDLSRKLLLPLVGRLDKDTFPDLRADYVGRSKPLCIGELTQFVGVPVVEQYLTSLEVALEVGATASMDVGSTADFPDAGTVLVDGERIEYTSKTASTLDGLTRGAGGTVDTTHPAGTIVFLATGQLLNGTAVDGPVFLLHGQPLAPGSSITEALAHGSGGRSAYAIPSSQVVADLQNPDGALVGLRDGYPQNPDQASQPAWYAVEMDAEALGNQAATWENAAGAEGSGQFSETNYALVFQGGRLALRRSADVEPVGGQRIERVYLLVEYANLTTPVPGGNHVPNDGANTSVAWRDAAGVEHALGTLAPEQEPLPEAIEDTTRTVRTRPLDDQHRHQLSAPVGTVGVQGGVLSVRPSSCGLFADPPANVVVKRPGVASVVAAGRGDAAAVFASTDSELWLGSTYDALQNSWVDFLADDERLLLSVFRTVESVLGAVQFVDLVRPLGAQALEYEVHGNDGVLYATGAELAGSLVEATGTVGTTLSRVWPLRQRVKVRNGGAAANPDQHRMDHGKELRLLLEPDAGSRPAVVLYAGALSFTGNLSTDPEALEVANGLRPTFDVSHTWTGAPNNLLFLDAPLGTADVKRVTLLWRGAPGATLTWRQKDSTLIGTLSNGAVLDVSNQGLSIADLHKSFLRFQSGSGITWLRAVVEYEGTLSDTDEETSQRTSSLKAFDITEHVDLGSWESLRQSSASSAANTAVIRSPDSTGAFNSTEKNNDALWVVRTSFLVKAAPPITSLAQAVSFTFRGLVGANQAGAQSRAFGDVLLELLTGASYLGIDGTDYFPDGWCDVDSFYSDVAGPTAVANGGVMDAQRTAQLLVDLADQALCLLLWEHGRLKLSPVVSSGWGAAVQTFTDAELLEPVARPQRSAESILNKVIVEYVQDYVRQGFDASTTSVNAASQGKYGQRRDEAVGMSANDYNAVDAPSVQDAQAVAVRDSMLARFAEPVQAVAFRVPLVGLALEVGDVVALSTAAYSASKVEIVSYVYVPGTAASGGLDHMRILGLVREV